MRARGRNPLHYIMPRSLKYQLLSRSLFIIAGLLFLIGLLQYVLVQQFLYRNEAATLLNEIHSIPRQVWEQVNSAHGVIESDDQSVFSMQTHGAAVAFIDRNGHFYPLQATFDPDRDHVGNPPHLSQQTYKEAMLASVQFRNVNYRVAKDDLNRKVLVVMEPVGDFQNPIGLVQVSTFCDPLQHVLVEQLMIFILLALGALVAGCLTLLPLLRKTLTPLSQMVATVQKINAGNLDERFSITHSQTEIELLSRSFNEMLVRLETSFQAEREAKDRMRQFIADASHELRTPLTSIHGFLEVLLRGAKWSPEQLNKALKSMYSESGRINKLVESLLLLARLDKEPTYVVVDGYLDEVLHDMEPQLRLLAGNRTVDFAVENHVALQFSEDAMKQVILNLFQNAVQHTDPIDGKIQVSLKSIAGHAQLIVRDNGIGISPEHQKKLFQRFYRVDSARSRMNGGGSGLGLAITKSIVESHGGSILCESDLGKGATFRIEF